MMRPDRLPDVAEPQTLPDWEALFLGADGNSLVFVNAKVRASFDFDSRMTDMEEGLHPHRLRLTQQRQVTEPLLKPDLEKQEMFRRRKSEHDEKRAARWAQSERIRQERYKAHNAYQCREFSSHHKMFKNYQITQANCTLHENVQPCLY